jgi:hypothetical protein
MSTELPTIETPLRQMITFVVNSLRKYGITPTRMKRDDVDVCLEEGLILQQTFEFKEEADADDQDTVTRVLQNAGWDTEWFTDGEYNTLTVTLDGYSFYEESYRCARTSCNQSA